MFDDYFAGYDADREREDAMFFESQPYNSFAAADQERHYLFTAGFTSGCDCNRCELTAEADMQRWDEEQEMAEAAAAAAKV